MKRCIIFLFLTFYFFELNAFDLVVNVEGLSNNKGRLLIGLFNSPDYFPEFDDRTTGVYAQIFNKAGSYTFKKLPEGLYAVAVIHDENYNDVLDTGFLGIPKEGYAFSNNITGLFGPPKFNDVTVLLKKDTEIFIELEYK